MWLSDFLFMPCTLIWKIFQTLTNVSFNLNSKITFSSNTNSRLVSKKSIGIMVYNNSNKYDDIIKIPKELG